MIDFNNYQIDIITQITDARPIPRATFIVPTRAAKNSDVAKSGFQGLNIACFFDMQTRFFEIFSKNRVLHDFILSFYALKQFFDRYNCHIAAVSRISMCRSWCISDIPPDTPVSPDRSWDMSVRWHACRWADTS